MTTNIANAKRLSTPSSALRGRTLARMRRLQRETPWAASVGCSLAIAILLLAIAAFVGGMEWTHRRGDDPDALVLVFAAVFGLVGLLMLVAAIHQTLARRTKETVVELDEGPLQRGRSYEARIEQEGPVSLKSLRMNLVCLEDITKLVQRNGRSHIEHFVKQIADVNVLDERDVRVGAGERWERRFAIAVPPGVEPSGTEGDRTLTWKLEVWGVVRGNADFMHPFVVEVV